MKNPYNWTLQDPPTKIARPELEEVAGGLREGRSALLMAGRGMGKSVALEQLRVELEADADVRVFLFKGPPAKVTEDSCLRQLGRRLGVDVPDAEGAGELFEAYFERDVPRVAVLLFDEFDLYGRAPREDLESRPGRNFFNSLETMRRAPPGSGSVGILAAGNIGSFVFRDALGSPFVDRAKRVLLEPFDEGQVEELARPFAAAGKALTPEVLEALAIMSGGNPALVTFGLETLWPRHRPGAGDVTAIFDHFRQEHGNFVRGFQISFSDPRLSEAPQRVLELIRRKDGQVSHAELEKACGPPVHPLHLSFGDVLMLLRAAGLIGITGSELADPVVVRPVPSFLNLPTVSLANADLGAHLASDIGQLLFRLHVSSLDFYRRREGATVPRLVPESVFSSFLSLGLGLLGWTVDREAQRAAGRTDLLLRRNGSPQEAVVEVKIWGRNDYKGVQKQVESYWTARTAAGAVVMLADSEIEDWPARYRQECLSDDELVPGKGASAPVHTLRASSRTRDGFSVEVDHFLLRLPRRSR